MYKIKRFVNCTVPTHVCNLKCPYCYISQTDSFTNKLEGFNHSVEFIAKALSVSRLGGVSQINLCAGGETLLSNKVIKLAELLLEDGHFVSLVTNGTITDKIVQISELSENLQEKIFIKFSFHYLELKRTNLLDVFFYNVKKIQKSKCSFSIELTVNDESVPYIEDIKKTCMNRLGVLCHVMEARDHVNPKIQRLTKIQVEEHQKIWGSFDSSIFDFQQTTWGVKRNEFCYAGDWTLHVNLDSGDFYQCFMAKRIQNLYTDIEDPIEFVAIGENCSLPHCYTSYAWLTIGGAIPSLSTPFYSELRNKVLENGEEWLKSPVKEFFSSRPSEMSARYSPERKTYINALMSVLYNNCKEHDKRILAGIIERSFEIKGIKKVALYGFGTIGRWLLDVLEATKIEVEYVIDRDYENIKVTVECVPACDIRDSIDAIIVTPIYDFHPIKKSIGSIESDKIISVKDLV